MANDAQISDELHPRSIFLSYAREDKAIASALAKTLSASGHSVWWDALIEGGAAFAQTIEAAIEKSDALVVLWSKASIASDWVRDEAAKGRDLGRLVPISLDGTVPPMGFRQYHVIDFTLWTKKQTAPEIGQLINAFSSISGRDQNIPEVPQKVATRTSRRELILLGGAITLAAGTGLMMWQRDIFGKAPPRNTIAVLPFVNLSGDATQDYFSQGLSEEVRTTLARNSLLQVMAQTSSAKFRNDKQDSLSIAAKLGVAFLLSGSVRRAGTIVRITAELTDGATGFTTWTQNFDRSVADIFAVQSEIARTVATAISAKAGTISSATKTLGGTTNVAAYDAYWQGRAQYDLAADEATDRAALANFETAIVLDPTYAAAYAAKSRALTVIANNYAKANQLRIIYAQAIEVAKRAIELAPTLADAHSTLAYALFNGRLDIKGARKPFDLSRKLGPGEATVLARFALYCAAIGRAAEAQDAIERALRIDPLNPLMHRAMGIIYYEAHEYAKSLAPLKQAHILNPKIGGVAALIGNVHLNLGNKRAALHAYNMESTALVKLPGLAIVEQKLGNIPAAKLSMARLITELGDGALYQQAQVRAQWGERDAAITLLERAYSVHDSGLILMYTDPYLAPLRQDLRFVNLLKKLGFIE
jgi:TolB-like protein/tetratricopeptide (TPR) repeat protein